MYAGRYIQSRKTPNWGMHWPLTRLLREYLSFEWVSPSASSDLWHHSRLHWIGQVFVLQNKSARTVCVLVSSLVQEFIVQLRRYRWFFYSLVIVWSNLLQFDVFYHSKECGYAKELLHFISATTFLGIALLYNGYWCDDLSRGARPSFSLEN